jgi:chaperone modulatory protein CbpM
MNQSDTPVIGNILDEYTVLSLEDLCRICAVEARRIVELVEEGVLSISSSEEAAAASAAAAWDVSQWRFAATSLRRARLALRLQHDLEINLAGVALALDLMEEIEQLRRTLRQRGRSA